MRKARANIYTTYFVCTLAVFVVGCGSQTYESRLKETNLYFKYREKIDGALVKRAFEDFGVKIRVPKGFVEIPPPAEGDDHDQRQPTFFRSQIPGLLAAWQHEGLAVEETDPDIQELPAWIFLCTNHQRWLDKASDAKVEPMEFHDDIATFLANQLRGYSADQVASWEFRDERVPRQNETAYVPRKDYSWIKLDDSLRLPDSRRAEMEIMLTVYYKNDIQLALISVAPKNLLRRDQFYLPIQLCMETLSMTGDAPRPRSEGPETGGGF